MRSFENVLADRVGSWARLVLGAIFVVSVLLFRPGGRSRRCPAVCAARRPPDSEDDAGLDAAVGGVAGSAVRGRGLAEAPGVEAARLDAVLLEIGDDRVGAADGEAEIVLLGTLGVRVTLDWNRAFAARSFFIALASSSRVVLATAVRSAEL